jgi:V/A-type H+-transporting ATPase subunit A
LDYIQRWWVANVDAGWAKLRLDGYELLQREDALKEIVRLLGPEALPDEEKLVLDVARMIKIGFLQQSAYDDVDSYCSPKKQVLLLHMFVDFYREALSALQNGVGLSDVRAMPIIPRLLRAKFEVRDTELEKLGALKQEMVEAFKSLSGAMEVKAVVK